MEQIQKENKNKKLPTKTKVAAWWMIVNGGMIIFLSLIEVIYEIKIGAEWRIFTIPLLFFISFCSFIFLIVSARSLLKQKEWAWWFSMCFLAIAGIYSLLCFDFTFFFTFFRDRIDFIFFLIFLVSLISFPLLFLDRKNFFEVAK